ncbi:ribosomal rna-processing 8 [Trichoderma cornu-damae]|uniref:Ribosomal RNA-processing protein 8 n=1 Tax=Trichoderma cornu-damae TaxID=654480 RepID=A0A9P8TXL2_9HYPO|nr:ribosomal rna-processing 8 [Trichoderma cornu-damae]
MFAVPGWSVSSDALKAEKPAAGGGGPSGSKSRKRKRTTKEEPVTAANVADLWESVVEGKKARNEKSGQDSKRQKNGSDDKEGEGEEEEKKKKNEKKKSDDKIKSQGSDKKSKKDRRDNANQHAQPKNAEKGHRSKPQDARGQGEGAAFESSSKSRLEAAVARSQPAAAVAPAPPKLTPLQASMREKLISARFRHLNETLYTRPSEEAFKLFQESPEMFDEYHEGFRRQVKVWPENPVDGFLQDIRTRAKIMTPGKGRPNAPPLKLIASCLPRTAGTCTIADLGCGDARLAESLQADKDKLRLDVRSFDLQSPSPLVTKADIADIPMEDGSVNVAIFCLALMGTNWLDFVEEAYRLLHWKGELWVAEIKSRFGPVRNKNAPVTHSVGNRRKPTKKEAQAKEAEAAGRFERDLAVEVDGQDDQRRETDVSAFVEALRRRGFVLQGGEDGREAVDLSNRMFVTMRFIKGAAPTRGKGVGPDQVGPKKKKVIFGRMQDEDADVEGGEGEGAILKPCVYKIR